MAGGKHHAWFGRANEGHTWIGEEGEERRRG